jgi:hypothetical protein
MNKTEYTPIIDAIQLAIEYYCDGSKSYYGNNNFVGHLRTAIKIIKHQNKLERDILRLKQDRGALLKAFAAISAEENKD